MVFSYKDLLAMSRVTPGKTIQLRKDYDPSFTPSGWTREMADQKLQEGITGLAEWQDRLFASDTYALLIVFQALDAAGKDGTIKHVMSGVNPQGVTVTSFKVPTDEELSHDYLWRQWKALPERGRIGIFNRSHYEEVLVTRVHPEFLDRQNLPPTLDRNTIWKQRFNEINQFEKYLVDNGILVLKFFLNVSKDQQKKRFLERMDEPDKNWKFSPADARERKYWDDYLDAYEAMFNATSTPWAPWYIIPADHKWVTHLSVASIIYHTLADLHLVYPQVSANTREELLRARQELEEEEPSGDPEEKNAKKTIKGTKKQKKKRNKS